MPDRHRRGGVMLKQSELKFLLRPEVYGLFSCCGAAEMEQAIDATWALRFATECFLITCRGVVVKGAIMEICIQGCISDGAPLEMKPSTKHLAELRFDAWTGALQRCCLCATTEGKHCNR